MTAFKIKTINSKNRLGEILKRSRERYGIPLESLSKQLNIKYAYLKDIEEDRLSNLPGEFYIKNYIKKYATSLNLCWPDLKPLLDNEIKIYQKRKCTSPNQKSINKISFLVLPKIFKKVIIIIIVLIFSTYLAYQIWQMISPPDLEILNPEEKRIIHSQKNFTLSGQTEKEVRIKINGKEILPDETGFFSFQIELSQGVNLIKIEAKKRYSRTATREIEIVFD